MQSRQWTAQNLNLKLVVALDCPSHTQTAAVFNRGFTSISKQNDKGVTKPRNDVIFLQITENWFYNGSNGPVINHSVFPLPLLITKSNTVSRSERHRSKSLKSTKLPRKQTHERSPLRADPKEFFFFKAENLEDGANGFNNMKISNEPQPCSPSFQLFLASL